MILVSVFDKKAESFSGVINAVNVSVAIRDFSQACLDPNSNLNRFPEDFDFYLIGSFDQKTGKLEQKQPQVIASALQFIKKEVQDGEEISNNKANERPKKIHKNGN